MSNMTQNKILKIVSSGEFSEINIIYLIDFQ
nr:MAG TPA: hypothetical protein [Herelleviridae sp.]